MGDRNYHEFTEDINDASMCVCGVPALGHDAVYRRADFIDCGCVSPGSLNEPGRHFCGKPNTQAWSPEDHCFREDGCGWHGSAPADGSCCCCGQPADAHTGCDCE